MGLKLIGPEIEITFVIPTDNLHHIRTLKDIKRGWDLCVEV